MASTQDNTTPLTKTLITKIKRQGSIPVFDYMMIALADSQHGYYRTSDPLGKEGDFTTAPEISQVFGELVGAWLLMVWDSLGKPQKTQLIELGPGRGTLMADILRTSKVLPTFLPSIDVHMVETSTVLKQKQQIALQDYPVSVHWHDTLKEVNQGITLLVANEFLDALPVEHYIKQNDGWYQRLITIDHNEKFIFTQSDTKTDLPDNLPYNAKAYQDGDIFEYRPYHETFIQQLADRAKQSPLIALIIDYGHSQSNPGETFQAMKSHQYTDPLVSPGSADLTAHVDFEDLTNKAQTNGLKAYEVMTQGHFLMALGLAQRTQKLLDNASQQDAKMITTGAQRLVDPNQMGQLFKVLVITSPEIPILPPFAPDIKS